MARLTCFIPELIPTCQPKIFYLRAGRRTTGISTAKSGRNIQKRSEQKLGFFTQPLSTSGAKMMDKLPQDVVLQICDHMNASSLLALSLTSTFWKQFCCVEAWPRRLASILSVRAVHIPHPPRRAVVPHTDDDVNITSVPTNTDPRACFRILHTLNTCASSRILCLCVHMNPTDSLTSLAISYGVTRDDICRTNCLYTEYQLSGRTHVYVPLLTEDQVLGATGKPASMLTVALVRDASLSNKLFAVVACRHAIFDNANKGLSFVVPRRVVAAAAAAVAAAEARVRNARNSSGAPVSNDQTASLGRVTRWTGGTVRGNYPPAPA